ncbi:ABC transporter ATP-binding protein [Salinicoccus albus]|uniref:ABC transporter ATP-binding protein n=1 Tax=Salinicoccus albus TaxID=418756 RepID=UPI000379033E|nr:ABC transporter ATP-binding protein [Salinicoccus albus]
MSMLELKNLTKTFGSTVAADDVSFTIDKGEIFGFIGPNGAGKSTTIRMIIGALTQDSGSIFLDDTNISKDRHYKDNISYVPGDVNLWGNLTGDEVINFFMKVRNYKNTAYKNELIEKFRLDPKKKCKTYSKGNRQKVALISAFLTDAKLLIFDEPTTGLDPLMERSFHEEVARAKSEGKSILLSSHILSEVEKLSDRIAIIREGKIIETGHLDELSHITRIEYIIQAKEDLSKLDELPFVHEFRVEGEDTHVLIDNDKAHDFLQTLYPLKPTKLQTLPPRLEDIFMRYYEGGRDGS